MAFLASVITGVSRWGSERYSVSSTRLGSIMIKRSCEGPAAVQERVNERVYGHRLARAGSAGNKRVRHLGDVGKERAAGNVAAQALPKAAWRVLLNSGDSSKRAQPTVTLAELGTSMPTSDLPGIGASMRMPPLAASASSRFCWSATIFAAARPRRA
jgi:hypothetical protein